MSETTHVCASIMACLLLHAFLPIVLSFSGYSAEIEDQTVITILDAYPKEISAKAWAATPKKVCYPDIPQCFELDGVFKHHGLLPHAPEVVNVKMHLNTRKTGPEVENTEVLEWRNPETLKNSTFDPSKPTMIFVHGFLAHVNKPWLVEMMQVSLLMDDINAIRIGWAGGSQTVLYPQAVADTRLVAAEVSLLIGEMVKMGADIDSLWLIGHSLGAHTVGFVGQNTPGIGRITGLDPAEPYFQGHHEDARLDPTDAKFVDVIHTDASSIFVGGFGSADPMGHVDYYPNGGHDQPGCKLGLGDINSIENAKKYVVCNHERSFKILIETMRAKAEGRSCHFKAHRCSKYENYLKEECQECGEGCTFIGPDAILTRPKTTETLVKMYLITYGEAPYCAENFFDLTANLPSGFEKSRGQIFAKVDLTSQGGQVVEQELTTSKQDALEPTHSLHHLMVKRNDIDIDQIKEIQVRYKQYWSMLEPSTWGTMKIKFHSASITHLASDESTLSGTEPIEFCLDGEKDFELIGSKDDEWKTLVRCH